MSIFGPIVEKNKLVSHVENNEFQLANTMFENSKTNSYFKDESAEIIKMLDEKMENLLVDLYNEKADFDNATEAAKLYTNIASLNGLPTENAETFQSTIEMYKELDSLKSYLKKGESYDELGKGLLSSIYTDVEVYTEVLARDINETNKNEILAGLDAAVDQLIEKAESIHSFAKISSLLKEENTLSSYLLDNATRNKLKNKIDRYNNSRVCVVSQCTNWANERYCSTHQCDDDDCSNLRKGDSDYCSVHMCAATGCDRYNYGDTYCSLHECDESDCKKYANNGNYCSYHASQKTQSYSSSGSSGSFTNKYGSRTTRCVVSGCSNYIASSGDTNCCASHSNRCGNCNCYIDGDAMFCMSCIASALR